MTAISAYKYNSNFVDWKTCMIILTSIGIYKVLDSITELQKKDSLG
jgi:hypothetical protein